MLSTTNRNNGVLALPVEQVSLEREKMERGAVERQLVERAKELADLQSRFDAHSTETSDRSITHFLTNTRFNCRKYMYCTCTFFAYYVSLQFLDLVPR